MNCKDTQDFFGQPAIRLIYLSYQRGPRKYVLIISLHRQTHRFFTVIK